MTNDPTKTARGRQTGEHSDVRIFPQEPGNEWQATVRAIFAELNYGEMSVRNDELARKLAAIIEERHPRHFIGGRPPAGKRQA
jgi:hypothetical protein